MMIVIDYEEFKPETYKGIYVHGDDKIKSYTGDPIIDMETVLDKYSNHYPNESVFFSSRVDDFISDSKKYSYKRDKFEQVIGLELSL
jgi:hypothetical protein